MKNVSVSIVVIACAHLAGCISTKADFYAKGNISNPSKCNGYSLKPEKSSPIIRPNPVINESARENSIKGFAVIEFDVSEAGRVINTNVVNAYPGDVFSKPLLTTMQVWQYKPKESKCHSVRLDYDGAKVSLYGF